MERGKKAVSVTQFTHSRAFARFVVEVIALLWSTLQSLQLPPVLLSQSLSLVPSSRSMTLFSPRAPLLTRPTLAVCSHFGLTASPVRKVQKKDKISSYTFHILDWRKVNKKNIQNAQGCCTFSRKSKKLYLSVTRSLSFDKSYRKKDEPTETGN